MAAEYDGRCDERRLNGLFSGGAWPQTAPNCNAELHAAVSRKPDRQTWL